MSLINDLRTIADTAVLKYGITPPGSWAIQYPTIPSQDNYGGVRRCIYDAIDDETSIIVRIVLRPADTTSVGEIRTDRVADDLPTGYTMIHVVGHISRYHSQGNSRTVCPKLVDEVDITVSIISLESGDVGIATESDEVIEFEPVVAPPISF